MATSLKSMYGPEVVDCIGHMVAFAWPAFPRKRFLTQALDGFASLELMDRGRHVARALVDHLPRDYPEAVAILLAAADAPVQRPARNSLSSFLYLPFTEFVRTQGLDHPDVSLAAMHALTQRFTAEFCIRPYLVRFPDRTLAQLRRWAEDPSADVRRLVSEGTRPRLPWAPRLPAFQADPSLALPLLELLRDDPSPYVRRSVANHLNDIGKDHPERLVAIARQWIRNAPDERRALLRHALRSLLKAGHPEVLGLLGHAPDAALGVDASRVSPRRVPASGSVEIGYRVHNPGDTTVSVIADCRVGFVRADGSVSWKVFRLGRFPLAPGESREVRKHLSLAPLSTRRHYPGKHPVEAQVNGQRSPIGVFTLLAG